MSTENEHTENQINELDNNFEVTDEMLQDEDDSLLEDFIKPNYHNNQDEDEDEDENEDEEELSVVDKLFGVSDNEEEDEEDSIDLDSMNKFLKKDFQTKEELKSFLDSKKEDNSDDFAKEEAKYEQSKSDLDYWNNFKNLDNEEIVRTNLKNLAIQDGKDIKDEDVLDDIESEIDIMKSNRTLTVNGQSLRSATESKISELNNFKSTFEQKKTQKEQVHQQKIETELKTEFADIFAKKSFFGVLPTQDKIKSAYDKTKDNTFIDSLKDNKKMQARIALFVELEEEISKRTNAPDFNDGVKSIISELGNKKSNNRNFRSSQKTGSSASSNHESNLVNGLLASKPKA